MMMKLQKPYSGIMLPLPNMQAGAAPALSAIAFSVWKQLCQQRGWGEPYFSKDYELEPWKIRVLSWVDCLHANPPPLFCIGMNKNWLQ